MKDSTLSWIDTGKIYSLNQYIKLIVNLNRTQRATSNRAVYDSLDDQLATAAKFVLEMVPTINYVSVDYFPQIGYLVTVPEQDQHLLQQSDPISTLQQQPIVPVIPVSENDETDFFHSSGSPSFGLAYNVIEDGDAATFNSTQTRSADVRKRTYSGFQFIFKQSGTCYFKHKIVEGKSSRSSLSA